MRLLLLSVSLLSTLGCAGATEKSAAPDAGPAGPCQVESDCPSGFDCGYLESGGCSTPGVCVPKPSTQGPFGGALLPLCACNGVQVERGSNFYGGYVPVPISGIQLCPDAGAEAGSCSAWGGACVVEGECCGGLQCINPNAAVPGYCVP
jgi:hypothetical protein